MRKIKRFKIATRQKEILRKLLRTAENLRQAGFEDETALARFIATLAKELDPGTVYEFNQDAHWELGAATLIPKEMFSACAVTLGSKVETFVQQITNPQQQILANTALYEFLRTAILFVTELIREQAEKEECEILDMQLVYTPLLGVAAEPKILREAVRLDKSLADSALPLLLEKLNASKIDVALQNGQLTPKATVVFLIPWQRKKKKGKK